MLQFSVSQNFSSSTIVIQNTFSIFSKSFFQIKKKNSFYQSKSHFAFALMTF